MEAGNFFESVPSGGDCYVLKGVISQLDDAKAITLLQNVRQAMQQSASSLTQTSSPVAVFALNLIVVAHYAMVHAEGKKLVLVEADFIKPHDQRQINLALDLVSMTVYQGKGRTQEEFARLLTSAGFDLKRVVETRSPFTVIEAVAQPHVD